MPTYLPPRVGISMSEAIAESYSQANINDVMLYTLELHHSDFVDDDGNPTAARLVNDWVDHNLGLEASAPLNAGETVTFKGLPFKANLPEETDTGAPAIINIEVENVSRHITPLLDKALPSQEPVLMIIREYMSSDKTAPHKLPVVQMYLTNIVVTPTSMTAGASFGNLTNRRFPGVRYTRITHPGLAAR